MEVDSIYEGIKIKLVLNRVIPTTKASTIFPDYVWICLPV